MSALEAFLLAVVVLAGWFGGGWWLRNRLRRRPAEQCETCGQPTRRPHTITATFDDEDSVAGSSISATFCPDHCEGGCDRDRDCDKEHDHAPL